MIEFKKMKVGQRLELDPGKWEDIKYVYDHVQKWCSSKENKKNMQFQFNLRRPGSRSAVPVTKDVFEIERVR